MRCVGEDLQGQGRARPRGAAGARRNATQRNANFVVVVVVVGENEVGEEVVVWAGCGVLLCGTAQAGHLLGLVLSLRFVLALAARPVVVRG